MTLLNDIHDNVFREYRSYIEETETSRSVGDCVVLYGKHDITERNTTYEVQVYLPGWVAIGDDSGGSAILIRLDGSDGVYRCGHGALGSVDPELIADSFANWLADGCPIADD